jgi:polyribonucleotide nucleotidyltransferase
MNDATFESSEILLLNASTSLASFSSSSLDFFSAAR